MPAEPGEGATTRQMVNEATRAITARAAKQGGISRADMGHGIDGHLDGIASRAAGITGSNPGEIRQAIGDNHRREFQLAAVTRTAQKVLESRPAGGGAVKSAIGTKQSLGQRPQATRGAAAAPAIAHRETQSGGRRQPQAQQGRSPRAPAARTAEPAGAARQTAAIGPTGSRPMGSGREAAVAPPPPRPQPYIEDAGRGRTRSAPAPTR